MQTLQFECKKDGLRQTQDGGLKLTLAIHPQDVTAELLMATMGQAFMCVLAPVDGGEPVDIQPPPREEPKKELTWAQKAGALCRNPSFHSYLENAKTALWADYHEDGANLADVAKACIYSLCGIASRKELDSNQEALACYKRVYSQFSDWERRMESFK